MRNQLTHQCRAIVVAMTATLLVLTPAVNAEAVYDPVSASFVSKAATVRCYPRGALPRSAEALYGVNISTDELLTINNVTAAPTVVGPVGSPVVGGLAYDQVSDLLYGTDTSTNNLVTIDPSSGATTVVGNTGVSLLHGLAMNPTSGILYASNANSFGPSDLWRVDKSTGAAALVGPIGFSTVAALAFDPVSGVLYGARSGADAFGFLITIDTTNGTGTLVGNSTRLGGLAFEMNGDLYGADNGGVTDGISRLYRVNKTTGAATLIGPIVAGNVLDITFNVPATVSVQPASWTGIKALFRSSSSDGR